MIFRLLPALALLLAAGLARADDSTAPAADGTWCQQHPQRCEAMKSRLKAKCDAYPAKCEEVKQRVQEKAAECQSNPQACKDERRAELEAACKSNPDRPICKRLDSAPATP
jgi:Skp family chaperone for outer membrane proteins